MIEPPNSVLLVVGREEFTPPRSFGGATCAATGDCVAIGVVRGAPTSISFVAEPQGHSLIRLGDFTLETEGMVSIRDVYHREQESIGVTPGAVSLVVWVDDDQEPGEVLLEIHEL